MQGKNVANDIFVDVDAKCMSDLLGDVHTAEFGIAQLELQDCGNELGGGTFRARLFCELAKKKRADGISDRPGPYGT